MKDCVKRILPALLMTAGMGTLAADLELTADQTVDVSKGETLAYDALTGGEFTLTKTGAGTLSFKAIANADASVILEGGTLRVAGETVAPAVFQSADMWFDASAAETFKLQDDTVAPADWAGAVKTWLGAGGTVDGLFTNSAYTSFNPFLIAPADTMNGLPLVDFGTQRQQYSATSVSIPGQGGYMVLEDAACKSKRKFAEFNACCKTKRKRGGPLGV